MGSSLAAQHSRSFRSSSSTRSQDGLVSARSSSSRHHGSSPLPTSQGPVGPSGLVPNSLKAEAHSQPESQTQSQGGELVDKEGARLQPAGSEPLRQNGDGPQGGCQEPAQQAGAIEQSTSPRHKHEPAHSLQDAEQQSSVPAGVKPQDPQASLQSSLPTPKSPHKVAQPGKPTGSSAVGLGGGTDASPVGSASTDAWEMVQDANNIYNWKAGSLCGRSLSTSVRQGSGCSEEGQAYSQCGHLQGTRLHLFLSLSLLGKPEITRD